MAIGDALSAGDGTFRVSTAGAITAASVTATTLTGALTGAATSLAAAGRFISSETTGTGSAQNVAHGLGVIPSAVLVSFTELPADLAAGADIAEGTHTTTNVVLTVTSGVKFKVLALV
jgi:hypothetical protein